MAQFSPEGIEELRRRIAKKARNDDQFQRLLLFNNISFNKELIESAILMCDIMIENNDVLFEYPPSVGRYVIITGGRISDLINEELGEEYGYIQIPLREERSG